MLSVISIFSWLVCDFWFAVGAKFGKEVVGGKYGGLGSVVRWGVRSRFRIDK